MSNLRLVTQEIPQGDAPFKLHDRVRSLLTIKFRNHTDYSGDERTYTVMVCQAVKRSIKYPSGWRVTTNKHKAMDAGMFERVR